MLLMIKRKRRKRWDVRVRREAILKQRKEEVLCVERKERKMQG